MICPNCKNNISEDIEIEEEKSNTMSYLQL